MQNLAKYSRSAAFAVCNVLFICCFVLSFVLLQDQGIQDKGIAEVKLNLSAAVSPFEKRQTSVATEPPRSDPSIGQFQRSQPTQRDIGNLLTRLPGASEIKSRVQGAATTVRSAVSAVETEIREEINETLERANVPAGISLGTKRVCIEYRDGNTTCETLPLEVAKLLPDGVAKLLGREVEDMQAIQDKVAAATLGTILLSVKLETACVALALAIFNAVACYFHTPGLKQRLSLILLSSGLATLLSAVPFAMLLAVTRQIEGVPLPPVLDLATGDTHRLALSVFLVNASACISACYTVWKTPIPLVSVARK